MAETRVYCYGFHCDEQLLGYDVCDACEYHADGVMLVHRDARAAFAALFAADRPLPANVILWGVDPWDADPEPWRRDVIKRYPSRVAEGESAELRSLLAALDPNGRTGAGVRVSPQGERGASTLRCRYGDDTRRFRA